MPVSKRKTRKSSKTKSTVNNSSIALKARSLNSQTIYDQLKLSESYISLILGAVVVVAVSVVFFAFIREARKTNTSSQVLNATTVSPVLSRTPERVYVVQENESLWDIAVRFYGDGFAWTKIVEANKSIDNPDYVPPGTKIIIPSLK